MTLSEPSWNKMDDKLGNCLIVAQIEALEEILDASRISSG
jgi:hypothetical protein